jgi:hypothetical protein
MKTCVVRRRFWATEADNATVDIDLEPNFGVPKGAAIFFVENNAATDAFETALASRNIGVTFVGTGGTFCVNIALDDNVNPTVTGRAQSLNAINAFSGDRATVFYRATTATFQQDKIRLLFANQTPQVDGHLDAFIWAVTGDDVTVGVGFSTFSTTTGTSRIYSGLGFTADFVFVASANTTLSQSVGGSVLSFGAATRLPLQQSSVGWFNANGAGTAECVLRVSDTAITQFPGTGGAQVNATIGTFTANGWTMTNNGSFTANTVYNFLAVKSNSPTDFAILNINTPTATGASFSGLGSSGFIPETVIGMGTTAATRDLTLTTRTTGADGFSIFAGSATSYTKLYNGNGTITYSTASSTVSGTATTFWKFHPGTTLYTVGGSLIGTVSTVASLTSLTLTGTALLTGTATSYTYSTYRQGALLFGDRDGNTANTLVFSGVASKMYSVANSQPSIQIEGTLNEFDTRPGIPIDYTLVRGVPTFGWIAAFKNFDDVRRRGTGIY